MSVCLPCARGFHHECFQPHKPKKCKCVEVEAPVASFSSGESELKNAKRNRENISDPHSTGRKRAAVVHPIIPGMECEWKGQRDCGGGLRPIIGCFDGIAKHIHHGPVKDTLRNHEGNVHRICPPCHIHWHELNDLIYDEAKFRNLPHDPQKATADELVQNMLAWKTGEMGKRFELASTQNRMKGRLKND